jgi:hypothetical protein
VRYRIIYHLKSYSSTRSYKRFKVALGMSESDHVELLGYLSNLAAFVATRELLAPLSRPQQWLTMVYHRANADGPGSAHSLPAD